MEQGEMAGSQWQSHEVLRELVDGNLVPPIGRPTDCPPMYATNIVSCALRHYCLQLVELLACVLGRRWALDLAPRFDEPAIRSGRWWSRAFGCGGRYGCEQKGNSNDTRSLEAEHIVTSSRSYGHRTSQ